MQGCFLKITFYYIQGVCTKVLEWLVDVIKTSSQPTVQQGFAAPSFYHSLIKDVFFARECVKTTLKEP